MEVSDVLGEGPPGKRSFSQFLHDANTAATFPNMKKKRPYSSGAPRKKPRVKPEKTLFRILCLGHKAGSIIGKSGSIIKSIRQDTDALIRIDDPAPGTEERVVSIIGRTSWGPTKKDGDGNPKLEVCVQPEADVNFNEEVKNNTGKALSSKANDSALSPAQEALLRVYDRIVEDGPVPLDNLEKEEGADGKEAELKYRARLLVPTNQVGCVLGKKGKIIERIRKETGCQMRVLPKDLLPPCAAFQDELVQITGDLSSVKKALQAVSSQLQENPPKEPDQGAVTHNAQAEDASASMLMRSLFPPTSSYFGSQMGSLSSPPRPIGTGGGPFAPLGHTSSFQPNQGSVAPESLPFLEEEITIRMLCPKEKIGNVIGKGGGIIRSLREETGAKIRLETGSNSDECVVFISARERANDNSSKVREAAVRVQGRIADMGRDQESILTTKLLVPGDQAGCLIGKGGSIMSEMRRATHANIRIYGKDQLPSCAMEKDELVMITGNYVSTQEAVGHIVTRLQNNIFREKAGLKFGETLTGSNTMPGFAPPGAHSLQGNLPTGSGVHVSGAPQQGGGQMPMGYGVSQGTTVYTPSLDASGHRNDYPPSSALWPSKGAQAGSGFPDYSAQSYQPQTYQPQSYQPQTYQQQPYQSQTYQTQSYQTQSYQPHSHQECTKDFSRSNAVTVTYSVVEVSVPENVVGSIIGQNGSNIGQICKISGAKLKLQDLLPGASERKVEISGTPDQIHAAQSLLQAFILSGQ